FNVFVVCLFVAGCFGDSFVSWASAGVVAAVLSASASCVSRLAPMRVLAANNKAVTTFSLVMNNCLATASTRAADFAETNPAAVAWVVNAKAALTVLSASAALAVAA